AAGAAHRAPREGRGVGRRRQRQRPRRAVADGVGVHAAGAVGRRQRQRHWRRRPDRRPRHRRQDRHRPDDRELEVLQGPGPRLVRGVRAGEGSRGRGGRARRAWRSRRRGGGADRATDLQHHLPGEGRGGRDSRMTFGIDRRLLQNVDWPLLGATVSLVTLSATTLATLNVGRAGGGVALRQIAWFGLGIVALTVVASIDYRRLVRAAPLLYLVGLGVLVTVFALGRTVSRARRCLMVRSLSVPPSLLFNLCFDLLLVEVAWRVCARPLRY